MNTEFNYYDFLKRKEFLYDVKVDLSGLNLQADASSSEIDPDNGTISEVNLNEVVDEEVNFVYNPTTGSATFTVTDYDEYGSPSGTSEEHRFAGQDVIEVADINFDDNDHPRSITLGNDNVEIPIFPRHYSMTDVVTPITNVITAVANQDLAVALNDVTYAGVRILTIVATEPIMGFSVPSNEPIYQKNIGNTGHVGFDRVFITIEGADDGRMNGEFEISSYGDPTTAFNVRIPTYKSFTDTPTGNLGSITQVRISYGGFTKRSTLIDRDIYAAFGLWGSNNYSTKNNIGVPDNKSIGYLSKKRFYRALQSLRDRVTPLGIEVVTTEYRKKLTGIDINGDGEDDLQYDANYSYLPKKRGFRFSRSMAGAKVFLAKQHLQGNLFDFPNDEITPFTMSVKDAFIAQFESAEELNSEFIGVIRGIIDSIQDNPLLSSMIDLGDLTQGSEAPITTKNIVYTWPQLVEAYAVYNGHPIYNSDDIDDAAQVSGFRIINSDGEEVSGDSLPDDFNADPSKYPEYNYNMYQTYYDEDFNDGAGGFILALDSDENPIIVRETIINDDVSVNLLLDDLKSLEKAVGRAQIGGAFVAATFSPALAAALAISIQEVNRNFELLDPLIRKIKWFQKFTNQSVFNSGELIYDRKKRYGNEIIDVYSAIPGTNLRESDGRLADHIFPYNKQMARILIPVDFGTKREKYKAKTLFGTTYTAYRKVDMGVRWVEVRFIDTKTYTKYRKNNTPSGNQIVLNIPFESMIVQDGSTVIGTLSESLPDVVMSRNPDVVSVTVSGSVNSEFNGQFSGRVISDTSIEYTLLNATTVDGTTSGILDSMVIPYPPTQQNDDPRNIRVTYNMPHLPFDGELRDKIFDDFGPFDQSEYANKRRGGDFKMLNGNIIENSDIPGWQIFNPSSKLISDMRGGIDVYNKVQFLLKILQDEFGESRVNLIETTRSSKDQDYLQLGGPASTFLSWHNFGLAVKIVITQEDYITPIVDGSADLLRLLEVADAFISGARNGAFGTPMNVVWCGQLVTGPDLFVWEFLPIGVEHKDALKFRDSALQQKDAIIDHSYVNVTAKGYVIHKGQEAPTDVPYIREDAKGMKEAIVINGEYWVHPKYLKNYTIPSNLILKDLQEFLTLIQVKMNSNGTQLVGRKKISEWKTKNPKSFTQLVLFYGLTGALSTTRSLLSGDYIEKFQTLVNSLASKDPVAFVQRYLGSEQYNSIKIYIEDLSDSSYINLSDGTLVTPVLEARSKHPEGSGNTFGQKQIDYTSVEFGQYQNGVFIPEGDDRIIEIRTTEPVISGYINGQAIEGDAVLLHSLIANQLVEEFNAIKDNFNNLSIKFMHDKFNDGSNASLTPLLENEFGVIKTQDILTFDELRDMYKRIGINSTKSEVDGTVRGAGANIESQYEDDTNRNRNQSVFEKLVSNSQLSGVRIAKLTREKPIIEELANNIKVEDVIAEIQKKKVPNVRDIL